MDTDSVNPLLGDAPQSSSPCQAPLLALIKKTGYSIVQENGQRKYGGPPPGWEGPHPPRGCEVFVGKIPRDMYEDELVPVFERVGVVYEFRLMMEFSGENRGYAFVMYTTREEAQKAIQMLDNYEIRPGKFIGVCVSLDNCRLFVGSIPKDKTKDDILTEMKKVTEGVVDVIVYPSVTDKSRNRGFAFVEYNSHKAAAMARRKLIPGTLLLWGQTIQVDWAEPEKDADEDTMQRVKVLYVRNLMLGTSEETLRREFSRLKPGCVERVKKMTDYAFVHFGCRDDALAALRAIDGTLIDGVPVEVTLAKPAGSGGGRGGVVATEGAAGGGGGRRYSNRGYPESVSGVGAGGEGGPPHMSLSPPARPVYLRAGPRDTERCVLPFNPGTPISPTGLQSLKPSQLSSAVCLLEYYCCRNAWSLPQYYLYTAPSQDGRLLLLYKVVISSTQSSYMPDRLCTLVEDAKELAAQNALWNLDCSMSGRCSPSSMSPPLGGGGGGLVTYGRSFCPTPPATPYPLPPLSPPLLPSLDSSFQSLYLTPSFY